MTRLLFLDTEYNGFGGELISLALYDPHGESFYEVVGPGRQIDPWVAEHVIPFLDKLAIGKPALQRALRVYLAARPNACIIADWPADFCHLFELLMIEGHWEVDIPITARLLHSGPLHPEVPHNALSDAEALARWYLAN